MPIPQAPEAGAEPLALTVHSVQAPDLADRGATQRTASGRAKMLIVLALCAAPVLASYVAYFFVRPSATSSYATLIQPTRSLPKATWTALDGRAVPTASLRGQWLLLVLVPDGCGPDCERLLLFQRQLREMLGGERDRVDKIVLHIGTSPLPDALRTALATAPAATVLKADRAGVEDWLQPAPGQALESHLYLIDPMGEWMMRTPVQPDPYKFKRDLERVLRASASWDRAGR